MVFNRYSFKMIGSLEIVLIEENYLPAAAQKVHVAKFTL